MKKRLIFILLLAALLLGACGTGGAELASGAPSPPPDPVEYWDLPGLGPEESQAMARFLNANRVLLKGHRLYCYDFDADWSPVLARYTWKNGTLSGFTVLARGCVPEYLCLSEGWLYYIDRSSGALERVREGGGERTVLRAGPCRWLSQRDGLLYYCDAAGRFLSLDPRTDGETVLLEGPGAFPWPLEGAVLYRAEEDGGRLHLRRSDGGDTVLSAPGASTPLIWEDRLWYCAGGALHSVGLDGQDPRVYGLPEKNGDIELLPTAAGLSLRGIRDENGPVQWAGGPEGPFLQQPRGYRICDWLGDGVRVDTVYEPDGRIRCYLLTGDDETAISFLAGRTT